MTVVGVDACRAGWIGVALGSGRPRARVAATLTELGEWLAGARAVALDIPIGHPGGAQREADRQARRLLGPRGASVFPMPVRDALLAEDHAAASRRSRERTGRGLSRQAHALAPRILEAEAWVATTPVPVWEVHPEVSFAHLLGRPARASKRVWDGMRERLTALEGAGIRLDDLGAAGARAGTDDVLDAAAAAWSADRLARGAARCLPDPPEHDPATGRAVAIWA